MHTIRALLRFVGFMYQPTLPMFFRIPSLQTAKLLQGQWNSAELYELINDMNL